MSEQSSRSESSPPCATLYLDHVLSHAAAPAPPVPTCCLPVPLVMARLVLSSLPIRARSHLLGGTERSRPESVVPNTFAMSCWQGYLGALIEEPSMADMGDIRVINSTLGLHAKELLLLIHAHVVTAPEANRVNAAGVAANIEDVKDVKEAAETTTLVDAANVREVGATGPHPLAHMLRLECGLAALCRGALRTLRQFGTPEQAMHDLVSAITLAESASDAELRQTLALPSNSVCKEWKAHCSTRVQHAGFEWILVPARFIFAELVQAAHLFRPLVSPASLSRPVTDLGGETHSVGYGVLPGSIMIPGCASAHNLLSMPRSKLRHATVFSILPQQLIAHRLKNGLAALLMVEAGGEDDGSGGSGGSLRIVSLHYCRSQVVVLLPHSAPPVMLQDLCELMFPGGQIQESTELPVRTWAVVDYHTLVVAVDVDPMKVSSVAAPTSKAKAPTATSADAPPQPDRQNGHQGGVAAPTSRSLWELGKSRRLKLLRLLISSQAKRNPAGNPVGPVCGTWKSDPGAHGSEMSAVAADALDITDDSQVMEKAQRRGGMKKRRSKSVGDEQLQAAAETNRADAPSKLSSNILSAGCEHADPIEADAKDSLPSPPSQLDKEAAETSQPQLIDIEDLCTEPLAMAPSQPPTSGEASSKRAEGILTCFECEAASSCERKRSLEKLLAEDQQGQASECSFSFTANAHFEASRSGVGTEAGVNVDSDLRALILRHSRALTRDSQHEAGRSSSIDSDATVLAAVEAAEMTMALEESRFASSPQASNHGNVDAVDSVQEPISVTPHGEQAASLAVQLRRVRQACTQTEGSISTLIRRLQSTEAKIRSAHDALPTTASKPADNDRSSVEGTPVDAARRRKKKRAPLPSFLPLHEEETRLNAAEQELRAISPTTPKPSAPRDSASCTALREVSCVSGLFACVNCESWWSCERRSKVARVLEFEQPPTEASCALVFASHERIESEGLPRVLAGHVQAMLTHGLVRLALAEYASATVRLTALEHELKAAEQQLRAVHSTNDLGFLSTAAATANGPDGAATKDDSGGHRGNADHGDLKGDVDGGVARGEQSIELSCMRTALREMESELERIHDLLRNERRVRQIVDARSRVLQAQVDQLQRAHRAQIARSAHILQQVQFYFSPDNLRKDVFLRGQMHPSTGFVALSVLVGFPRMQKLGVTAQELFSLLADSSTLEIDETMTAVRPRRSLTAAATRHSMA